MRQHRRQNEAKNIGQTVALLIALILSKGIYYFISTHKYT